jgi:hypothetical protein
LLVGIALAPRGRALVLLFAGLAAAWSLWDQSRWQPWFFQYLFMLAAFALCPWPPGRSGAAEPQAILNTGRFILAATYIWSGLQKCNWNFVHEIYPWLLEPFLSEPAREAVMPGALVAPVLETAIGVGLLLPATRRVSLVLVLGMHAALLVCLGPLGHGWNNVVWPWNVAMMAAACVLFWRTPDVSCRAIVRPGASVYRWVVVVLFGVMPVFSFVSLWDSYLSASLYSGNLIDAELLISETVHARSPDLVQRCCNRQDDGRYKVDVLTWSMEELNVPPYQEPRIFRTIARRFCALAEQPTDVVLVIRGRPHMVTGARQATQEDGSTLFRTGSRIAER